MDAHRMKAGVTLTYFIPWNGVGEDRGKDFEKK